MLRAKPSESWLPKVMANLDAELVQQPSDLLILH